MKFKTTKKAVMNGYDKIISVGYCALQFLLHCESESAYTVRREGWGADIYDFGNVAIVTGYVPFGNIRPGYELCQKYEKVAEQINGNYELSWAERKAKLQELIKEFIGEQHEKALHPIRRSHSDMDGAPRHGADVHANNKQLAQIRQRMETL